MNHTRCPAMTTGKYQAKLQDSDGFGPPGRNSANEDDPEYSERVSISTLVLHRPVLTLGNRAYGSDPRCR